jgi:hypothetical protein
MPGNVQGGFYISGSDSIFIIVDSKSDTINQELRRVIFHELVHALDDQIHNFIALQHSVRTSDEGNALRFCIEGDAEFQESRFMYGWMGQTQAIDDYLNALVSSYYYFSPYYSSLPYYWAYFYGGIFVNHVSAAYGMPAIDQRIFNARPVRTRDILDPSLFIDGPHATGLVDASALLTLIERDYTVYDLDELGEVLLCALLREWGEYANYRAYAHGLVADRIVVFEKELTFPLRLCWYTCWENEAEAAAFFGAYRRVLARKHNIVVNAADSVTSQTVWESGGKYNAYLEQNSEHVYIMEQFPLSNKQEYLNALRTMHLPEHSITAKTTRQAIKTYPRINKVPKGDVLF